MVSHYKGVAPKGVLPLFAGDEAPQGVQRPATPAAGVPPSKIVRPYPNVGHRGASGYAPENTLPAYDLALRLGANGIELDLQLTKDGVPVVLHDRSLDRTARPTAGSGPADHKGFVREKTLSQIKGCDVGSWFNRA